MSKIEAPPSIDIDGRDCMIWKQDDLWQVMEFNYQLREFVVLGRAHYRDEAIADATKVIRAHPRPIRKPLANAPAVWPPLYRIVRTDTGEELAYG